MKPEEKKSRKRTYEKPDLRTIELAAEEVLGVSQCRFLGPDPNAGPEVCITYGCSAS